MTDLYRDLPSADFANRTVDRRLKPGQVAALFGVDAKTVRRWAIEGKLPYIMTQGGHRRYSENAIHKLLAERSVARR
jgi:excisionase family DNA binding protein